MFAVPQRVMIAAIAHSRIFILIVLSVIGLLLAAKIQKKMFKIRIFCYKEC